MNKNYNLKLDLQFRCNNSTMKFNQFDNNTSDFFMRITNAGNLFDVEKAMVVLAVIKPSGKVASQFVEVENGLIYADLKPNMRDEIGIYTAQAMLILEDERIVTDAISYEVEEDKIFSLLNDTVETSEEFTLLTDMLSRLSTIEISEEQRMINEAERILSEENRKIEEAKRVEAELIRQHEEADRAKYDATRESNENIRKQNESTRLANETNRIDEEAKRVEEEANRVEAEQLRKDNYNFMTEDEERRRVEANAHKEAEKLRVQAETNRVNEEAKRRTTEQARVSAENTRVSNENTRKANETTRQTNETHRVEAETQRQNRYNSFIADAEANANNFENYTNSAKVKEEERKSNELNRKSQEDRRVSNEVERISNENTRKANENARIESEKQRVDAENLRKEKIVEIQSDYDSLKKVIIDENASANLQNQINQTNSQLEHIANKGTTVEVLERVTKEEINRQIEDGTIANLTLADNSIKSDKICDKQISINKTNFLYEERINLFDASACTHGAANANNGNIDSDATNWVTDFIPVEFGKSYKMVNMSMPAGWRFAYYDKNKEFIHNNNTTNWQIMPEGAKYLRFTVYGGTNFEEAMFTLSTVDTSSFIPFSKTNVTIEDNLLNAIKEKTKENVLESDEITNVIKNIIPGVVQEEFSEEDNFLNIIKPNNTTFFKTEIINYANENKMLEGYVSQSNGDFYKNAGYRCTDFIPTEYGDTWVSNSISVNFACMYDSNKQFIKNSGSASKAIIDDENIKFVRFNFMSSTQNKNINKSDKLLPYVPYEQQKLDIANEYYKESFIENIFSSSKVTELMNSIISASKPLHGLNLGILGDSITHWGKYGNYIADKEGCTFYNYGIGGTTIGEVSGKDNSSAMCNRYTSMRDDLDIILLFGGTNDPSEDEYLGNMSDREKTTFYGACHATVKGLIEKYPGKMIGVVLPIQRNEDSMGGLKKKVDILQEVAHYYSIPVLDMYNEGGITCRSQVYIDKFIEDKLHPNDEGNKILARRISSFIKTL